MDELTREQIERAVFDVRVLEGNTWVTRGEEVRSFMLRALSAIAAKDDDAAVDLLAEAMKKKLAYKRSERGGRYHGWQEIDEGEFWDRLASHVFKKDPVDIANYCAMIHALRMKGSQ
jgi:hypothetical protein